MQVEIGATMGERNPVIDRFVAMDVGELRRLVYHGHPSILPEMKNVAIESGHSGLLSDVIEKAAQYGIDIEMTRHDIEHTLQHSAGGIFAPAKGSTEEGEVDPHQNRGLTINDDRTSTGELYQSLYGRDFDPLLVSIDSTRKVMTDMGLQKYPTPVTVPYTVIAEDPELIEDENAGGKQFTLKHDDYANERKFTNYMMLKGKKYNPAVPEHTEGFEPKRFGARPLDVKKLLAFKMNRVGAEYDFGEIYVNFDVDGVTVTYFGNIDENGKGVFESMVRTDDGSTFESGSYSKVGSDNDRDFKLTGIETEFQYEKPENLKKREPEVSYLLDQLLPYMRNKVTLNRIHEIVNSIDTPEIRDKITSALDGASINEAQK